MSDPIQGAFNLINAQLLGDPPGLLDQARELGTRMKAKTGFRTSFNGQEDTELQQLLKEVCLMTVRLRGDLPAHWLTISGANGCGKTMLAGWLSRRFEERQTLGLYPRFWTGSELKRTFLSGGYGLLGGLETQPWLVIDELGAEKGNDAFREAVITMLNARMDRWTVITTNLSESEIEAAYTSRITSRMIRGRNVHVRVKAPDYATRTK